MTVVEERFRLGHIHVSCRERRAAMQLRDVRCRQCMWALGRLFSGAVRGDIGHPGRSHAKSRKSSPHNVYPPTTPHVGKCMGPQLSRRRPPRLVEVPRRGYTLSPIRPRRSLASYLSHQRGPAMHGPACGCGASPRPDRARLPPRRESLPRPAAPMRADLGCLPWPASSRRQTVTSRRTQSRAASSPARYTSAYTQTGRRSSCGSASENRLRRRRRGG